MRTLPALTLAAALALAVPAVASAQVAPPPPVLDSVSLNLSVEEWVRSETARVALVVDAASNGADAANLRAEIQKAAGSVADKAEWRIVRLDQRADEAGLDRWQAELEARLPEAQLANLADKAKKASRPGLQVRVGGVAFDPTLAEVEAAKAKLRESLYRQVTEEMKRLNAAFPDRQYRVGNLDFMDFEPVPAPQVMPRATMASMAKAEGVDFVAPGVQDKLRLTARVMYSAFATPPKN